MKLAMSDTGMVRAMMMVARQRPRKNSTTSTTKMKAYMTVSVRLFMLLVMYSDESKKMSILTSAGRSSASLGRAARTARAISTELAPDCFWINMLTPFCPLMVSSTVIFLMVSFTVAMSLMRISRPSMLAITTSLSNALSANSPSMRTEKRSEPMSIAPAGILAFSCAMICPICSIVRR